MSTVRASSQCASLTILIACGYGLFRGVNSMTYRTAYDLSSSSFIFIADFYFTLMMTILIIACAIILGVLSYKEIIKPFSMPFIVPIMLFSGAIVAARFGLFGTLNPHITSVILATFFAIHSVALSLAWIEIFAAQEPSKAIIQIGAGMIINVIVCYAIRCTSGAASIVVEVGALCVAGVCLYIARTKLSNAPDCTRAQDTHTLRENKTYKSAMQLLGDSFIAFFTMEAAVGLLNSFMLAGNMDFAASSFTTGMAMTCAAIIFWVLALAAQKTPRSNTVFRGAVPVLAAMVIFIPFFSEGYSRFFNLLLLISYDFIAITFTYYIAITAHKLRANSYV